MKSGNRKIRILWSVDAFDELKELEERAIQVLRSFSAHATLEIDPVYVLSPEQMNISIEFTPAWSTKYQPAAKSALALKLKTIQIPGLREPQILNYAQPSLKGTVEELSRFAEKHSYDLILVGSHGRKGLKRMVMGSFAEELLLQSKVPVLVVGGHSEKWGTNWEHKPLHILVPNDLSNPDSAFFPKTLRLAETLGARITLLHSIPRPAEQVFQSGVYLLSGGWVPVPVYIESERNRQKKAAGEVLARAKKLQIPGELIIDDMSTSVVQSILKHAQETNASMIAMTAESGGVASSLLGSITRQVVRSAPCPVWVFRVGKNRE